MTQEPKGPVPDPIGDLQRWLIKSGVRGVGRGVGDQVRSLFGGGQKRSADVWETATAPPSEEAPECAWCPICRAARMMKGSGPGLASHMATAGDTLATVVLDAVSTVESALSAAQRAATENGAAAGQAARPGAGPGEPEDSWQAAVGDAGPVTGAQAPAQPEPQQAEPADQRDPVDKQDSAGEQDPAAGPAAPQTPGGSPREPDDRG